MIQRSAWLVAPLPMKALRQRDFCHVALPRALAAQGTAASFVTLTTCSGLGNVYCKTRSKTVLLNFFLTFGMFFFAQLSAFVSATRYSQHIARR
eukprot:4773141-Pleurochrysis_carterae.AAC.1